MKPQLPKPGGFAGMLRPTLPGAKKILPAMEIPNKTTLDGLKPTDDLQADVDAEISAMDAGFRDRMKAEELRKDAATGSGEYFIVCFADGSQCAAFMQQLAQHVASVKIDSDDLVVDGRDMARWLKFEIPAARAVGKLQKIDPELKARSRQK